MVANNEISKLFLLFLHYNFQLSPLTCPNSNFFSDFTVEKTANVRHILRIIMSSSNAFGFGSLVPGSRCQRRFSSFLCKKSAEYAEIIRICRMS